jgi:hypothetical protein
MQTGIEIPCSGCGKSTQFDQPYPYHAGFGNQGCLYNDAGNLTLVWSSFDPAFEAVVGSQHPWMLGPDLQIELESRLLPAPSGGSWRFSNPARCAHCGAEISPPMLKSIYYLLYRASPVIDAPESGTGLAQMLRPRDEARSG